MFETISEILTLLAPVLGRLTGVAGEGVEVVPPLMVLLLGLRQGQQLDRRGDGEGGRAGRGGLLAGGAGHGGGGAGRGEKQVAILDTPSPLLVLPRPGKMHIVSFSIN